MKKMSLSLFLARRLYHDSDVGKQVSRPAVLIATIGVAIGLAVMIIAVSVIIGFKSEVRDKIIGFGSHIQISKFGRGAFLLRNPAHSCDGQHVFARPRR